MQQFFNRVLFSERLREKRGERSQAQMAKDLGMKQPMYARYESGKTLPSAELLYHLCSKLDVSSDWLLGLSDQDKCCQPVTGAGGSYKVEKSKERKGA